MFDPSKNFWGGHGIVGAQVPIGTGLAFAFKYNESKSLSLTYFGDGAANQGQVYESYNMASLWKLPVIFCIENNQYGMGTSIKRASAGNDLSKHGESFGIPGFTVDGMNPISVYLAGLKAAKWIRDGNGPIIMEMKTYRYRGHSMSDAQKYRTKEEVNEYRKIDPISQVKKVILENDFASEEEILSIDASIKSRVLDCQKFAEESPYPEKSVMYDAVYEQEDYNFISHKLK